MNTIELLHERYNHRYTQSPPKRIRGFKREELLKLFAELGYKKGAEIGVADGIHALQICQAIPDVHLTCVDPYESYRWKKDQDEHERCYQEAVRKLSPYNAHFWRQTSMQAAQDFENDALDFVYIDGDHSFDAVMMDIILWNKKVRSGGIVSGHDYYHFDYAGIVDAVNAYTYAHQIHEWFISDEREPEWFWAKP